MKKRGTIAVIEGHGGRFVLDLSIPPPPPLSPHPDTYSPRAGRSKAASEAFIFSSLQGSLGCRHISNCICSPKYSKMTVVTFMTCLFFYFLGGFLGSPLFLKTPYVVFNSGHMLSAACVVPASVFSSALSAGDDSVACFAFCSCSNTAFVQIQHLPCSFPLFLFLCPHPVSKHLG